MRKAKVGSRPNKRLKLNCETAVLSPPLEEYTIHNTKGAASGMTATSAAKSLLCFSKIATRMITMMDRMTGRMSCIFNGFSFATALRTNCARSEFFLKQSLHFARTLMFHSNHPILKFDQVKSKQA